MPFLKYDKDFVDVRTNFSGIEKSSKQNPVYVIPSFRLKLLKGIQKVAVSKKKWNFKQQNCNKYLKFLSSQLNSPSLIEI